MRREGRAGRRRLNGRQLLWWLWPELPSSWSEVPGRLRPALIQIARLTVAAVVSYLVADALFPGILDLTAPLTALLVVQASTVGTLLMGVVRVGAVLTGVLVAVGISASLGLSWWTLALVIAASLLVAMILRLGDQTLEAPISAMLILAVSAAPGVAAEVRIANTLIGTVVGIAFSLLVPVAIPNAQASEAVRRITRSQAALMDEVALTLGDRPPHPEEVKAWLDWSEYIRDEITQASSAVEAVRQSRRLNPRALATALVYPGLRSAVNRLDRALTAERALLAAIARESAGTDEAPNTAGAELRRAFAVVLDDVAGGLRAFGDLIDAEYGRGASDRADEALARTLEIVSETRAVLTELMLLEVDPREQTELWMLQGSVLAALDQVVAQLDLENTERSAEPWLTRSGIAALRTNWLPVIAPGARTRRQRSLARETDRDEA
ncbi:FUSC family protein [Naasia aerilata]|uniref:FUSC family protein n=2 Tax=Naasia aerilata TaxID=1162966 RepID=A0ABN6XLF0_9MICO|nr:FUSC family protein [Naasia aerilata]